MDQSHKKPVQAGTQLSGRLGRRECICTCWSAMAAATAAEHTARGCMQGGPDRAVGVEGVAVQGHSSPACQGAAKAPQHDAARTAVVLRTGACSAASPLHATWLAAGCRLLPQAWHNHELAWHLRRGAAACAADSMLRWPAAVPCQAQAGRQPCQQSPHNEHGWRKSHMQRGGRGADDLLAGETCHRQGAHLQRRGERADDLLAGGGAAVHAPLMHAGRLPLRRVAGGEVKGRQKLHGAAPI